MTAQDLIKQAYDARRDGDREGSLRLYGEAETGCDDDTCRAHCLRHRGDLLRELGRPNEAEAVLRQAEALYRAMDDDPLSLANTLRLLALIKGDAGLWRDARQWYEEAEALGYDMQPAYDECDRQITRLGANKV